MNGFVPSWIVVCAFTILLAFQLGGCASVSNDAQHSRIDVLYAYAQAANTEAISDFNGAVQRVDTKLALAARANSQKAAEGASGMDAMAKTLFSLVKDQMFRESQTDQFLSELISPFFVAPIKSHSEEIERASKAFKERMDSASQDLARGLAMASKRQDTGSSLTHTSAQGTDLTEAYKQHLRDSSLALGTSIPVVVGYVATEKGLLLTLLGGIKGQLSPLLTPAVRSILSPLVIAIGEGPIPFGKLLTLGSMLRTGYDLSVLRPKYKELVQTSVQGGFDKYLAESNQRVSTYTADMVSAYSKLNVSLKERAYREVPAIRRERNGGV